MANQEPTALAPHPASSPQPSPLRPRRKSPGGAPDRNQPPRKPEADPADPHAAAVTRLAAVLAAPGLRAADLAALVPLAERLAAEQARRVFMGALSRLQAELPDIPERGEIRDPDGRPLAAYALWEDCAALLRAPLARHGFALSFRTETGAGALVVAARLAHVGGHVEETSLSLPFDASGWKNPLQAIGSAAAYGKRYAAQALLNLVSRGDDDDARAAGGAPPLAAAALSALRARLQAAGASEDKLARYLGLSSLAALPAARLPEAEAAVAALAARRGA